jgi:hypothetical protein
MATLVPMCNALESAFESVESPPLTRNEPMIEAIMPMKATNIGNTRSSTTPTSPAWSAVMPRRRRQRDRGDDRAGVRLEEVGAHAGDVADVVADVVGDRGRVAGVVLGDAGLDLADEVGADVGRLGVDAAADTGEQRDGRGTESVGGDDLEGVVDLDHTTNTR